ncbi:hypothetical protein [Hungatella effluvii]|uniref:hypothetical protein n=1 Tax=Hungatella effluvii TaxID=1096246 RepID=UPI0022E42BBB|nr:hypothetical protein [Hungatella effluvii]
MPKAVNSTDSARAWFCVLNSPRTIFGQEVSHQDMVIAALDRWQEGKPQRTCAGNYEVGDTGNEHMHLVLCDPQKSRFSAVQKLFPGIHIEPMRGTKEDAENYILKKGRFEEKAHTVLVPAIFRGEIKANRGNRKDLEVIAELLEKGMTPNQIMDIDISYRRHEKEIRGAYYSLQSKKVPPLRDITVYWHVGEAGSGKTYTYVKLCEERGEDQVYLLSDYGNGGLDKYEAQKILFMDEFKGRLSFADLLGYLEGYKKQVHCRYSNILALWDEVHVTSVYPPESIYNLMVEASERDIDEFDQLKRRITYIVYHYKENGVFKEYQVPIRNYVNYENLKLTVQGQIKPPGSPRSPQNAPRQEKLDLVPDILYSDPDGFMKVNWSAFDPPTPTTDPTV